jgi:hypothetical protein
MPLYYDCRHFRSRDRFKVGFAATPVRIGSTRDTLPRRGLRMRMRGGLAHVRALLESNRLIRPHLERRDRELALLDTVSDRLPLPVKRHCRDATLRDGVLTLYLDSSAWSTRARFAIEEIAEGLRAEGVVRITTQVRPESDLDPVHLGSGAAPVHPGQRDDQDGRGTRLSEQTIAHLEATAEAMADEGLAEVFRRFARRHRGAERDD